MNFERHIDPKESIGIGLNTPPEVGKKFLVRFKEQGEKEGYKECMELEAQGKPVLALAKRIRPDFYDPFTFDLISNRVECIINGIPHVEFVVDWNEKEGYWETKFTCSRYGF